MGSDTRPAPMSKPSSRQQAQPAKISRPRASAHYPRTRLFKELDRSRRHPIVWMAAPGGAGKTTLASSYLAARNLKTLWYQLVPARRARCRSRYRGVARPRALPKDVTKPVERGSRPGNRGAAPGAWWRGFARRAPIAQSMWSPFFSRGGSGRPDVPVLGSPRIRDRFGARHVVSIVDN